MGKSIRSWTSGMFALYGILFSLFVHYWTRVASLYGVTLCLHYWARDGHKARSVLHVLLDFADLARHTCATLLPLLVQFTLYTSWLTAAYGPYVLLSAELILIASLVPWLARQRDWYPPPVLSCVLTRAQLRHPVWNVFIAGLSAKGVLLRVPFDATTDWVVRELERRHLVLPASARLRLEYSLLLFPAHGGLPQVLHRHQSLDRAGICNNATIHVHFSVYGGMPDFRTQPKQSFVCAGCGVAQGDQKTYYTHQAKAAAGSPCKPDAVQDANDVLDAAAERAEKQKQATAARTAALQAKRAAAQQAKTAAAAAVQDDVANAAFAGSDAEHTASPSPTASPPHTPSRGTASPSPTASPPHTSSRGGTPNSNISIDIPDGPEPLEGGSDGEPDDHARPWHRRVPRRKQEDEEDDEDEEDEEEDDGGWGEADEAKARDLGLQQKEEEEEEDGFEEEEEDDYEQERARASLGGDPPDLDETPPPQPPPPPPPPDDEPPDPPPGPGDGRAPTATPPPMRREIEPFTSPRAGAPIPGGEAQGVPFAQYESELPEREEDDNNPYHPFASKMDWDIAAWAKTHGIGANALTDLLKIDNLVNLLKLQFRDNTQLNTLMDEDLPERPNFTRRTYELGGEKLELYMRDSLEVVRDLFGRPDFATSMVFAPEKHYVLIDEDHKDRAYSDMHTGQWWWRMQKIFERKKPGATIIPLIISSDKTQLTLFRNRAAYPVYITIGNLPKEIRRKTSLQGQMLVGYIPVTKLAGIPNEDVRRRALAGLFHSCMKDILKPLRDVAERGVILESGDGVRRRCHPLLAAFVGDYPEQVLVAGVKYGQCPKGMLSNLFFGTKQACRPRDVNAALAALWKMPEYDDPQKTIDYIEACQAAGVKPVEVFWQDYPQGNMFAAIQPDILHQLYQGMVKHVISWLKVAYGAKALDARFKCLPENHQLRLFSKGISGLARVSGTEHQDICRVLLSVIADLPLKSRNVGSAARSVKAVRALLDFVYLAQYPELSETALGDLARALSDFHDNKGIFEDLDIRKDFNLPKLHALAHYVEQIKLYGTPDNFNTSYSERLHIDYAKMAYRASNRKDEYPQMVLWLQRREQIRAHQAYVNWNLQDQPDLKDMARARLPGELILKRTIAHYPSVKCVSFKKVARLYGADSFERVLREFITKRKNPHLSDRHAAQLAEATKHIPLPFRTVPIFHRLKFWHADTLHREGDWIQELPDSVVARPAYRDTQRRDVQGQFSTALIDETGEGEHVGVEHYRIGQIRAIFAIPETAREKLFPDDDNFPDHLAFIEWFTTFKARPEKWHHLYRVQRDIDRNGETLVSILSTDTIRRSVALTPRFGPTAHVDPTWTSKNVLERCNDFYVNSFSDKHAYHTIR